MFIFTVVSFRFGDYQKNSKLFHAEEGCSKEKGRTDGGEDGCRTNYTRYQLYIYRQKLGERSLLVVLTHRGCIRPRFFSRQSHILFPACSTSTWRKSKMIDEIFLTSWEITDRHGWDFFRHGDFGNFLIGSLCKKQYLISLWDFPQYRLTVRLFTVYISETNSLSVFPCGLFHIGFVIILYTAATTVGFFSRIYSLSEL
jgi:hypothetical protein